EHRRPRLDAEPVEAGQHGVVVGGVVGVDAADHHAHDGGCVAEEVEHHGDAVGVAVVGGDGLGVLVELGASVGGGQGGGVVAGGGVQLGGGGAVGGLTVDPRDLGPGV